MSAEDLAGKRLARLRRASGLTVDEICAKSGVARQTYYNIEGNLRSAKLSTFAAIAAALGVSLSWLFSDSSCDTCDGAPPPSMKCMACGAEGGAS